MNKKQKAHFARLMALTMAGITAFSLAGCGGKKNAETTDETTQTADAGEEKQVNTEVVIPGVYTGYVYNYDMLGDVTTLEMGYGTEQTLFERNTLTLTDNPDSNRDLVQNAPPYVDTTTTKRYELTKEFFVGTRGIHRIASFYGTYTVDGLNVTLNTPEYWSYLGYEGDGYASFNKPECAEFMVPTGELAENGTDYSLKFSGAIMPRHNGTNDPQTVIIDPNEFTFSYPVGNADDDAAYTEDDDAEYTEDDSAE